MSMLNNGVAGMNAASLSLNITSRNIANASVRGYSRQQAVYKTEDNGSVLVDHIERISDRFFVAQVQEAGTALGYSATYSNQMQKLENTVSADGMSLAKPLQSFFKSLKVAQAKPIDPAYRQQILVDAGNLASRFNQLSDRLNDQLDDTHSQMSTMVVEANATIKQVARLNKDIARMKATGQDVPELLDERDMAIRKLSELVGVDVSYDEDEMVSLSLSNGEPLVVSSRASELKLLPGHPNKSMLRIGLKRGGTEKVLRGVGGAVQAQINFRDKALMPARESLDLQAKSLAEAFNQQQAKGYDLKDNKGAPLFAFDAGNPAASLKVLIKDTDQLAFSGKKGDHGSNSNLLGFAGLQSRKLVGTGAGSKTLAQSFSHLLVSTASKTAAAKASYEASNKIHQNATSKLQSVAGVSLDEEAARMVMFQQSYNANAKVIATTNKMLDTLLQL